MSAASLSIHAAPAPVASNASDPGKVSRTNGGARAKQSSAPTATASTVVNISSGGRAAALAEATETSAQTVKEAASGDHIAQRRLAQEANSKPFVASIGQGGPHSAQTH